MVSKRGALVHFAVHSALRIPHFALPLGFLACMPGGGLLDSAPFGGRPKKVLHEVALRR
jgi:hypothetical protein